MGPYTVVVSNAVSSVTSVVANLFITNDLRLSATNLIVLRQGDGVETPIVVEAEEGTHAEPPHSSLGAAVEGGEAPVVVPLLAFEVHVRVRLARPRSAVARGPDGWRRGVPLESG